MNEFSKPLDGGRILVPILQTGKLKLREVMGLTGGHGGPSYYHQVTQASEPVPGRGQRITVQATVDA